MRLELSEQAESTLREELADECRRREEAEREREDLRRELVAFREARESPESPGPNVVAPAASAAAHVAPEKSTQAQETPEPQSSWWRRWLGR